MKKTTTKQKEAKKNFREKGLKIMLQRTGFYFHNNTRSLGNNTILQASLYYINSTKI